jgi:putative acetyltransferase
MNIRAGDFEDAQVRALLATHLAGMHANSPPGTCYVLDLTELQVPEISFFAAWVGNALAGIGALKEIDARTGEIKSMRTHGDHLRKGVGQALLDHLIALARARNYQRVSLETGSGPAFEAALGLYLKNGFKFGPSFGDYRESDFNQFLHLDL